MSNEMEVDNSAATVMASAGTSGSVSVALHPLVIMNISEHWTRVKAQQGEALQGMFSLQQSLSGCYNVSITLILFNSTIIIILPIIIIIIIIIIG